MSKAALSFLPEEVPTPLVSSWEDSGDPWDSKIIMHVICMQMLLSLIY